MSDQSSLLAVVLCGGAGSRLWPLSRKMRPKQFLPLLEDDAGHGRATLFARTMDRIITLGIKRAIVVCHEDYRFFVANHLSGHRDMEHTIVTEPVKKNTAPATTIAALEAIEKYGDLPLLVMPSDHLIGDVAAFREAIAKAYPAARSGSLVVFGVEPTREETGFGYITAGEPRDQDRGDTLPVVNFREKPDRRTARKLLGNKNCYWNSGIFMFQASSYLRAMERVHPDIKASCERAHKNRAEDLGFVKIPSPEFSASPEISIDHAVMEHARNLALVLTDMRWQDMGSWDSLATTFKKDESNNRVAGDPMLVSSKNNIVFGGDKLVSLLGIDDCIVVNSEDAILVAKQSQAGKIKSLVDALTEQRRSEVAEHRKVYRPWGSYETLVDAGNFKVKILIIDPGKRLSLQSHQHRSEHWVVVKGEAVVRCDENVYALKPNQSTYIPARSKHRIENQTADPTHIVEVQCGSYLGEDDITRHQDEYGRA